MVNDGSKTFQQVFKLNMFFVYNDASKQSRFSYAETLYGCLCETKMP